MLINQAQFQCHNTIINKQIKDNYKLASLTSAKDVSQNNKQQKI